MSKFHIWMWLPVLLLALALVACDDAGQGDGAVQQDGDNNSGVDEGFGEEGSELGSADSTAVHEELEQAEQNSPAASPVAPEMLITRTAEEGAEIETEEPTATETLMPAANATIDAQATTELPTTPTAEAPADTSLVRATTLLGMQLISDVDEDTGELRDILFNEDGTIRYAILESYGGEEETVAVPWDQLNLQSLSAVETSDPEHGFTWADETVEGQVMSVEDETLGDDSGFVDIGAGLESEDGRLLRATALLDGPFTDGGITLGEESLGNVSDLLLDADGGHLEYVIIDGESQLLADQRPIAIPWQRLSYDEEDNRFIGDVDRDLLENSPEFDLDGAFEQNEIRMEDARREQLDEYWGVQRGNNGNEDGEQ